jgi:hypothetical protein
VLGAKRTQNEANFERQMCKFNAKSGFLETAPNWLVPFCQEHPGRARFLSWLGMTPRGKYKNSGNEAKEYLKTKEITLLKAANYARFACNLAQIRA